jgi:hypothetical protein
VALRLKTPLPKGQYAVQLDLWGEGGRPGSWVFLDIRVGDYERSNDRFVGDKTFDNVNIDVADDCGTAVLEVVYRGGNWTNNMRIKRVVLTRK